MAKKQASGVVEEALAEFGAEYRRYSEVRKSGGNPDRSRIDFFFGQRPAIPGIDQLACQIEAEVFGKNAASSKAA